MPEILLEVPALYWGGKFMNKLKVTLFFLVFPLVANALYPVWWAKDHDIAVECEAMKEVFPHLGRISLHDRTLTVEKNGETLTWTTRMGQSSNSKYWDNAEISLSVSLKPSYWGNYHSGTLVFEGKEPEFIPLFCYPK